MAKKINPEFLDDARTEHRKESRKFISDESQNQNSQPSTDPELKAPDEPIQAASAPGESEIPPQPEPARDEFKDKFDEYFKGMDGIIAGEMVVNLVDDLKANFLYLYARKNGIDIGKDAMMMDDKSRKFAAFLVDHAIKNNFFEKIKKYPLLAALGVIVISGGSTFMMLQMLKKSNDQAKAKDSEIEKLREELRKKENRTNATDVEDLNSEENKLKEEILKAASAESEKSLVSDFIDQI